MVYRGKHKIAIHQSFHHVYLRIPARGGVSHHYGMRSIEASRGLKQLGFYLCTDVGLTIRIRTLCITFRNFLDDRFGAPRVLVLLFFAISRVQNLLAFAGLSLLRCGALSLFMTSELNSKANTDAECSSFHVNRCLSRRGR
jgi:hypothetical protein